MNSAEKTTARATTTVTDLRAYATEATTAGDMVAVAVCQIAMGAEVTVALTAQQAHDLETLDLDADTDRARALVAAWIDDAQARA